MMSLTEYDNSTIILGSVILFIMMSLICLVIHLRHESTIYNDIKKCFEDQNTIQEL